MAHQALGQRLRQPQAFPPKRQVGQPVSATDVLARRRQHLETAVEHEGMQVDTGLVDGVRQHDLADRLAVPGPQRLKGAEPGAEADIGVRPGAIKRRCLLRRHAGFHIVNGDPAPGTAWRAWRRQYAASSLSPGPISAPVTLLIRSTVGGENATSSYAAARASSAGSTRTL